MNTQGTHESPKQTETHAFLFNSASSKVAQGVIDGLLLQGLKTEGISHYLNRPIRSHILLC